MTVLVAADGAAWEPGVVRRIEAAGLGPVRRCVDVADLVAIAETGVASSAVVSPALPGLDAYAVHRVSACAVVVAVGADGSEEHARALGIEQWASPDTLEELIDAIGARVVGDDDADERADVASSVPTLGTPGHIVAVWGPRGAPGRSTIAGGLAAAAAHAGLRVLLVDADPTGGTQAQLLGVLDEVSGLLAATRAANSGRSGELASHAYRLDDRLSVLTGLPRADLWPHVRPGAYEQVLDQARRGWDLTVVDCGDDVGAEAATGFETGPRQQHLTRASLEAADLVLACVSADPVGLARFVRAVHEISGEVGIADTLVVLNRVRDTIGWAPQEVAATMRRLAGVEPAATLPLDQTAVDHAVVAGRLVVEAAPDSRLAKATTRLASLVLDRLREPRRVGARIGPEAS